MRDARGGRDARTVGRVLLKSGLSVEITLDGLGWPWKGGVTSSWRLWVLMWAYQVWAWRVTGMVRRADGRWLMAAHLHAFLLSGSPHLGSDLFGSALFIRGCESASRAGQRGRGELHARKKARSAIAGQGRARACSPRVARFGAICTAATTCVVRGSQAGVAGLSDRRPKRKARCYRQVHQRPRLLVSGVAVACYHSFWGWRAAHRWWASQVARSGSKNTEASNPYPRPFDGTCGLRWGTHLSHTGGPLRRP